MAVRDTTRLMNGDSARALLATSRIWCTDVVCLQKSGWVILRDIPALHQPPMLMATLAIEEWYLSGDG